VEGLSRSLLNYENWSDCRSFRCPTAQSTAPFHSLSRRSFEFSFVWRVLDAHALKVSEDLMESLQKLGMLEDAAPHSLAMFGPSWLCAVPQSALSQSLEELFVSDVLQCHFFG
jgi:hypothetical protein